MTSEAYVTFPASWRAAPAGAVSLGAVERNEKIDVCLYLKPRDERVAAPPGSDHTRLKAALAERRAAQHADDIALVQRFAAANGLTLGAIEPARRLLRLSGPASAIERAFHTQLENYQDVEQYFHIASGPISLPADLAAIVEAVLGLDTRLIARPHVVPHVGAERGYLPNEIGHLYNFPGNVDGSGECIALIELGGGFRSSDITAAFAAMKVTPPAVNAISVDGALNAPLSDTGADTEVALDIEIAGGNAPGATIAVYFAPNTEAGFTDALSQAASDTAHNPSIISISWGGPEALWSAQAIQAMNSALQDAASVGISVFAAAGDALATGGIDDGRAHVDFPASSPWAIGCGGTVITTMGESITAEAVWNDGSAGTGGGISTLFPVPRFQSAVTLPESVNGGSGRGVPDVAADAAPVSGYRIIVFGLASVVGGTSAVAPLWSGLLARINHQRGAASGFFLPFLYRHRDVMREIIVGNNRPAGSSIGYDAGASWNACTGLGVPNGAALATALSATPTA